MTDKIQGEILLVGFEGPVPSPRLEKLILGKGLGGVILFGRNISGPAQLRDLTGRLQELRSRAADSPLLIAVDQEGGAVTRVREGATVFPGNRVLGEGGDEAAALAQGRIAAAELRALGINLNLAPVLDLYELPGNPSTGIRSLGPDPDRAAALGAALVRGFLAGGVVPVGKHFPGKGTAGIDSHLDLPVIARSRDELRARELVPFRAALAAGLPAVMVSHAAYPALEAGEIVPGTFSSALQRGLLRGELGFSGAVLTDDLGMGAIRRRWGAAEASVRALAAGADLLLFCHSPRDQDEALARLESEGAAADFSRLLSAAAGRVETLRRRLRPAPAIPAGGPELAQSLATRALRVFRDPGKLIPLGPSSPVSVLRFVPTGTTGAEEKFADDGGGLKNFLRHPDLIQADLPLDPSPEQARAAVSAAASRTVVFCAFDAYRFPGQQALLEMLPASGTVGAALRDPRDAELFPPGWSSLATYGYTPSSLEALAQRLQAEG